MSESNIELKDIYNRAILQDKIEGAILTKACEAKTRMDGSDEWIVRHLACGTTDRLAEKSNGDPTVAYGIASILYTSTILYGKIGEDFLRNKIQQHGEDFSQEEYYLAVAKAVMGDYNGSKKQKILDGIKDALSDSHTIENTAAKTGILMNEYRNAKQFEKDRELEDSYLNGGTVTMQTLHEKMQLAKDGDIDENTSLHNLNIIYDCLKENPSIIHPRYRSLYPEISEEKLLVYYIAKLSHTEAERVIKLALTKG